MQRKTVVLVCMVDSIHVARWIAQFDPTEVKFILFPSGPNRRVHPKIVEMIERGKQFDNQMMMVPFGGRLSLPLWAIDRFFSDRIRGLILRRVLKKTQPDFVHALEFQHAGYVTIRALKDKGIKTPFIATNYGSDIFWFQQFPRHRGKIEKILKRADRYSAECRRDYLLAEELGFSGHALPLGPNSGGINVFDDSEGARETVHRTVVAVKGYDGWVGRALMTLDALSLVSEDLRGFEIVVYSASRRVRSRAKQLAQISGLTVTAFGKGDLSHEEILRLFRRSALYVGVSLSDGISTSLIEAMAMGAFPIQTKTSCADEWIVDRQSGVLLDQVSKEAIAEAISFALENNELRKTAEITNYTKVREMADPNQLSETAIAFYQLGSKDHP